MFTPGTVAPHLLLLAMVTSQAKKSVSLEDLSESEPGAVATGQALNSGK